MIEKYNMEFSQYTIKWVLENQNVPSVLKDKPNV